jgi:hypothetical protein
MSRRCARGRERPGPCACGHSLFSAGDVSPRTTRSESRSNRAGSRSFDTGKRRADTPPIVVAPGSYAFAQVRASHAQVVKIWTPQSQGHRLRVLRQRLSAPPTISSPQRWTTNVTCGRESVTPRLAFAARARDPPLRRARYQNLPTFGKNVKTSKIWCAPKPYVAALTARSNVERGASRTHSEIADTIVHRTADTSAMPPSASDYKYRSFACVCTPIKPTVGKSRSKLPAPTPRLGSVFQSAIAERHSSERVPRPFSHATSPSVRERCKKPSRAAAAASAAASAIAMTTNRAERRDPRDRNANMNATPATIPNKPPRESVSMSVTTTIASNAPAGNRKRSRESTLVTKNGVV